MYKRILLAYDGSEAGQKALLDAREIADMNHATVHLIAVMPPVTALAGTEGYIYDARREEEDLKAFRAVLDEGLSRLTGAGYQAAGEVVTGEAVDEIVRCAQRIGADLIVVGHKHLGSWAARWWRGSVSKSLVEHAPCNVLIVITK
jgi:nucleotide-binding universal stress UspA family protein